MQPANSFSIIQRGVSHFLLPSKEEGSSQNKNQTSLLLHLYLFRQLLRIKLDLSDPGSLLFSLSFSSYSLQLSACNMYRSLAVYNVSLLLLLPPSLSGINCLGFLTLRREYAWILHIPPFLVRDPLLRNPTNISKTKCKDHANYYHDSSNCSVIRIKCHTYLKLPSMIESFLQD
jgi:hypothetical protein